MLSRSILLPVCILITLILGACQSSNLPDPVDSTIRVLPQATRTPEATITPERPVETEFAAPSATATSSPEEQTVEVRVTEVSQSEFEALQCDESFCQVAFGGFIQRPIAAPGRTIIDWTYPYGSTLGGTLEVHHGVEFQNSYGTPVLAAAAGEVAYAGKDDQVVLGPYLGFYGNVIILRHPALFEGQNLYTLYAHLSKIEVAEGDQVDVGMKIGEVGASGAADGSHLHFEVRLGKNEYGLTTNPVLWFAPITVPESGALSTLAGRVVDASGEPIQAAALALEQLGADGSIGARYYPLTYDQLDINAHPQVGENFVVSDIQPGDYRLALVYGRLYELYFTLDAGNMGFIELQLE